MTLKLKNTDTYKIALFAICAILSVVCIANLFRYKNAEYSVKTPSFVAKTAYKGSSLLPIGGAAKLLTHDDNYEAYLEETLEIVSAKIAENALAEKWVNRHMKKVGSTFLNARTSPTAEDDSNIYCVLGPYQEVIVIGECGNNWNIIEYEGEILYVMSEFIADTGKNTDGVKLTRSRGRVAGPNGSETYYNLDMSGIVSRLESRGYEGEYWVRNDGCKMFGDYIMVAANFDIYPYGSIVETSLGLGIVCDTGEFVEWNPTGFDIATNW